MKAQHQACYISIWSQYLKPNAFPRSSRSLISPSLPIYLSIYLSIYMSVYLSIYLSIWTCGTYMNTHRPSRAHDDETRFLLRFTMVITVVSFITRPRAKHCLVLGYRIEGGGTRHGVVIPVVIPQLHLAGMTTLWRVAV